MRERNVPTGQLFATYPALCLNLVVGTDRFEVDAERTQLAVKMRSFHANEFCHFAYTAIGQNKVVN